MAESPQACVTTYPSETTVGLYVKRETAKSIADELALFFGRSDEPYFEVRLVTDRQPNLPMYRVVAYFHKEFPEGFTDLIATIATGIDFGILAMSQN